MNRLLALTLTCLICATPLAALADPLPVVHPSMAFGGTWQAQDSEEVVRIQFGAFTVINNAVDLQVRLAALEIETLLFVAPTMGDTTDSMEQTVVVVSAVSFDTMDAARLEVTSLLERGVETFPRSVTQVGPGLTTEQAQQFFAL